MTLTTMIGALVALLTPFPPKPEPEPPSLDSEIERLTKDNERLTRSHARLVEHIESLEREILTEQHLCAHWKEAAQRIAKQSREDREERERVRNGFQELQQQQVAARQNPQAYNGLPQMQALVETQTPQWQQQTNLALQQAQVAHAQANWQGFCNCVPSRMQVWSAAQHNQPDPVSARIDRNRP